LPEIKPTAMKAMQALVLSIINTSELVYNKDYILRYELWSSSFIFKRYTLFYWNVKKNRWY